MSLTTRRFGAAPLFDVLSVGAVDVDNQHASFSNTGTGLDISAPVVLVLSSYPIGTGSDRA